MINFFFLKSIFLKNLIIKSTKISNTSSSNHEFINCIFQECKSSERGGAIFISNINSIIKFYKLGFLSCSSTYIGNSAGAVSIYSANQVYSSKVCFFNCSNSGDVANIQICSYVSPIQITHFNETTEELSGIKNSFYGSHIGGRTITLIFYQNTTESYSFSNTDISESGPVLNNAFGTIINFLTCFKTKGKSIMRSNGNTFQHLILNSNFINNSISGGFWNFYYTLSQSINLNNFFFFLNSLKPLIIGQSGTSIFSNCKFDFDASIYITSSLNLNYFNLNINELILIQYSNTYYCWNINSLINSKKKKKNLNINLQNLIIFNLFNYFS